MGSLLGVSQGSLKEPQFIHMSYKPSGKVTNRIGLVGIAVNRDTIEGSMKMDVTGSVAVFGAALAIGKLKPKEIE